MSTDVGQLEELARKAEEKAAAARAKLEVENEKRLAERAERAERERERDEQILATATETRERMAEEAREAFDAILDAAKALPLVVAIAEYRARREIGWNYVSQIQNAQQRLGRPSSSYTPEMREIALVDLLDHAVRELSAEYANEALETRAAEREAFIAGEAA